MPVLFNFYYISTSQNCVFQVSLAVEPEAHHDDSFQVQNSLAGSRQTCFVIDSKSQFVHDCTRDDHQLEYISTECNLKGDSGLKSAW